MIFPGFANKGKKLINASNYNSESFGCMAVTV